ncbi:MAG: HlyC/CorC family transporter [Crocinitomicaceae bacterium]|nr:HlyC/CorC family transporter [Crocinitomicaceae bacterium]
MLFDIFITLFLVFLNGFFVAAEFAIVKVRASQLEVKAKAGNRFAILSKHIVSHLDGYLAATQLGITLASLGLGWIGEPVVSKMIMGIMHAFGSEMDEVLAHRIALPIAFAIITVLHIVFGELAPKTIAIQRSEKTALVLSYPLQFFYFIFRPFIWVLNGIANFLLKLLGITASHGNEVHSSDELKYLVQLGKESGEIGETNYDIIKNAFEFSDHTAEEIMVPRTKVIAIDLNDYNSDTIDKMIDESFSRIPCYEDSLDNITGIVHLKDILKAMRKGGDVNVKELIAPVLLIPQNKRIGQLLKEFQSKRQQMAVVVDEYGGTIGIITMEDILEELVGEIQDEYDNETPFVEKTGDKTYSVLASATLDDVNDLLPHEIEKDEAFNTLAGYLIHKFGKIPSVNEKISVDNYEFTILKKTRTTITLVRMVDLTE